VGAAQATVDDAADARGAANETRRGARSVPHRLAPGGDRGRHRQRYLQLSARSRQAAASRSREGRYLLRTNLVEEDPAKLWSHYLLLVAVEEAFKNLKSLPLRKQGAISQSGRSFTSSRPASRRTS
jgi:hypothetical protein